MNSRGCQWRALYIYIYRRTAKSLETLSISRAVGDFEQRRRCRACRANRSRTDTRPPEHFNRIRPNGQTAVSKVQQSCNWSKQRESPVVQSREALSKTHRRVLLRLSLIQWALYQSSRQLSR